MDCDNPTVSVIIPCYNAEKYLEQAVHSAEVQSSKELEIICIDDGSTDGTLSLLEQIQRNTGRELTIIRQKNRGVSAARNAGLKAARGKYIAFLDADDMLSPRFAELLVNAIEKTGAGAAYGRWTRGSFDTDGAVGGTVLPLPEVFRHFMYKDEALAFYGFLYRRDILKEHSVWFPEDIRYGEDSEFLLRYFCHIQNAVSVNTPVYYYRENEGSAMHRVTWAQTDAIRSVERTAHFLEEHGFPLADEFRSYMVPRVQFSAAKIFAVGKKLTLFRKCNRLYPVRRAAKALIGKNGWGLTFAAAVALVDPMLLYYGAGWAERLRTLKKAN